MLDAAGAEYTAVKTNNLPQVRIGILALAMHGGCQNHPVAIDNAASRREGHSDRPGVTVTKCIAQIRWRKSACTDRLIRIRLQECSGSLAGDSGLADLIASE